MAKIAVVGGGLSGLSFAWRLKKFKPDWEITIFEKDKRVGGKAWTIQEEGFKWERGVNGVLTNKPATLNLSVELGIEVYKSNDNARKRFVVKNGKLVKLPEKPQEFLMSGLLSPLGKLRVFLELLTPKKANDSDESLKDFAIRRLGIEAFENLIDPMATGIYAGDPEKLSLKSCFPRINELEMQYGGLIRAMLSLQQKARKEGKKGPGAGPGGHLVSFNGGMEELVTSLTNDLKDNIVTGAEVSKIYKKDNLWEIILKDNKKIEATHVVLSSPLPQCAQMISDIIPEIKEIASNIPYPPVAVVALGIKKEQLKDKINGFGFLCPNKEKRNILGTLWDSSVFPNRAPEGYALMRSLVGGMRMPELARLNEDKLTQTVIDEIKDIMDVDISPDFIRTYLWEQAIPQYNVGHADLMKKLDAIMDKNRGLYFRCNWVGGISLNDCINNSMELARQLTIL
jgi:oxygen-dependent protoporphyrinogen oxidase